MEFPKTYRTSLGWAMAAGAIIALIAGKELMARGAIVGLIVFGGLGATWAAWEHKWLKGRFKCGAILLLIWGGMSGFGWWVWPPPIQPKFDVAIGGIITRSSVSPNSSALQMTATVTNIGDGSSYAEKWQLEVSLAGRNFETRQLFGESPAPGSVQLPPLDNQEFPVGKPVRGLLYFQLSGITQQELNHHANCGGPPSEGKFVLKVWDSKKHVEWKTQRTLAELTAEECRSAESPDKIILHMVSVVRERSTIRAGVELGFNVIWRNTGNHRVTDVRDYKEIDFATGVSAPFERQLQEDFLRKARTASPNPDTHTEGAFIDPDHKNFISVFTRPLDHNEASALLAKTRILYLMSWVTWKDSNGGTFEKSYCNWLEPSKSAHLVDDNIAWHQCAPID